FSPDGKILLSCGQNYRAILWNVPACTLLGTPLQHPDFMNGVVFAPDGRSFLTATEASVRFYDLARPPSIVEQALKAPGTASRMAFSRNRKLIALAGGPQVQVFEVDTGERVGP